MIIADTKFEFGRDATGELILADEVLTLIRRGSGRYRNTGRAGRNGHDKRYLRDWSSSLGDWDRRYPGPVVPPEVAGRPALATWRCFEKPQARSGVRELAPMRLRSRDYLIFVNFPISVAVASGILLCGLPELLQRGAWSDTEALCSARTA